MSGDNEKSPFLTFSGLAIIAAAVGFSFFTLKPFKGARPNVQDVPEPGRVSVKFCWLLSGIPFMAAHFMTSTIGF